MEMIVAALMTGWITLLVLAMSWMVKGRIDEMGGRIDRVETRLNEQGAELRALRSDVTQIALAVGARGKPDAG